MFRKLSQLVNSRRGDEGLTLVELLIAVVILGLVSMALVGGLGSNTLVARKTAIVQNKNLTIDSAFEILEAANYKTCNANNTTADYTTKNPYSAVTAANSFPSTVKVTKIEIYGGRSGSNDVWTECPNWTATTLPGLMQRVTITDSVTGATRQVFKSFKADPADYGNGGTYALASLSAIVLREGVVSSNITATVSGALSGASTRYYVVNGTSSFFDVTLNDTTGVFTVKTKSTFQLSSNTRGQVVIGAFDTANAVYAVPTAFSVAVTPAISVTSTITNPISQIVNCGFLYSPNTNCAANYSAITTNPTGSAFSTTSSYFTINSSSGALAMKATTPAGTYSVPITITNGTASTTFLQEVTVFDKLAFATTFTVSKANHCGNTGFKSTSSSAPCTVTLTSTANTGSGQDSLTATTTNATISVSSTAYDLATSTYSITLVMYYKQNQTCKTGTSGTVTVTISDPGYSAYTAITMPTVAFAVTC